MKLVGIQKFNAGMGVKREEDMQCSMLAMLTVKSYSHHQYSAMADQLGEQCTTPLALKCRKKRTPSSLSLIVCCLLFPKCSNAEGSTSSTLLKHCAEAQAALPPVIISTLYSCTFHGQASLPHHTHVAFEALHQGSVQAALPPVIVSTNVPSMAKLLCCTIDMYM